MSQPRQPFLHDLVTTFVAPTQVLSDRSGRIGSAGMPVGAEGVLHADVRVLSAVELTVDGAPGEHIATQILRPGPDGSTGVMFSYLLRHVGPELAETPDPQVRLDRERQVRAGRVAETLRVTSLLPQPVTVQVELLLAYDLAPIEVIRVGDVPPARPFAAPAAGPWAWGSDEISVSLAAPGAAVRLGEDATTLVLDWTLEVPARGVAEARWAIEVVDEGGVVIAATSNPLDAAGLADRLSAGHHDHRLRPWLERSLADLNSLRMATRKAPEDIFFAAGSPWYLTLFGRDSLWTARLLLPVGIEYAMDTLRTLAGLAGNQVDVATAQEPGKIPHELRRAGFALGAMKLPPLYYGTIDATLLWICVLHDAWRAGAADADVEALLPALEAALHWMTEYGDADGDGFLEYLDASGRGLANQGWKDSSDSIRFADGRIAAGPVALCEVQGYAYEAAVSGAALLDGFSLAGGQAYRRWAADLAGKFRERFWCGSGPDRFPALALDRDKERVDSLSSNIGHLLGTGLLDPDEELAVARHLAGPELDSGWGLRTMSSAAGAYSPLSYHCGSVWPHDTAIAILGLHRAGLGAYAEGLAEGLMRAAVAFEYRLPELWSGEGAPVPYPTSCRPQAWSAAAAVVVATVL